MLIGTKNIINDKLMGEISKVLPLEFIEYKDLLHNQKSNNSFDPSIAIVNLMDTGGYEESIVNIVRNQFPTIKIVALHSFKNENLINKTLAKGFDAYMSVFDLSENFGNELERLGIDMK